MTLFLFKCTVGVGSLDDVTMTTVGDALPEDRPQTSDGGIGEDGNIHDEVIEEIIGSDSSSDEEDGKSHPIYRLDTVYEVSMRL